ncbi:hypothetical protein RND71_026601 [Anisodus tanguticus]|uniref:Anticodon-binding domain-containing protein n=1 Tax=Anisodus tanguticus TaxID=243964 RepID=A0AAE1RP70_9SOLA|nr:hypothetical protein RND71_026601 [Anisodus tanguticus]
MFIMFPEELGAKIKEYDITSPDTKNPLSEPYPFNLMFHTSIGPSGVSPGYMRPETAQGIFVNFKDLYYYNGNKLPFAAAQIGQAFRNELCFLENAKISLRQGLLSVREFTLAEIEHFVDPEDKSHPKFPDVANLEFLMFPREDQVAGKSVRRIPLGDTIARSLAQNSLKPLPRFPGFLDRGIHRSKALATLKVKTPAFITFIEPSFGIGRIIYCLYEYSFYTRPSRDGNEQLNVFRFPPLVAPIKCTVFPLVQNQQYEEVVKQIARSLAASEISYKIDITDNFVETNKEIGCLKNYSHAHLLPHLQPIPLPIYSLILRPLGVTKLGVYSDDTCWIHTAWFVIGKKYTRTDELGVRFAITVDSTSSVTVRERDSKQQIPVNVDEVASVIKEVTDGQSTWADVLWRYPTHSS